MKNFLYKVILFNVPVLFYFGVTIFVTSTVLPLYYGPSTKQQIMSSFENVVKKDYALVMLGNSRIYRGLNPDSFTLSAFNFSHDNDGANQMFHKLEWLIDQKKEFEYLILGVDYFQFSFLSDTRNYVYIDYLGAGYNEDYGDNLFELKLKHHVSNANPLKFLLLKSVKGVPCHRKNGQYVKPGRAKESDGIKRDANRLKLQETYFQKTIDLCVSKNITVFLVMPPARAKELNSYTKEEIMGFDDYLNNVTSKKNVFYLNYSRCDDFIMSDFTDITHLNEKAAEKFSKTLNDDIIQLIKTSGK
jgi:hypothetical protein